MGLEFIDSLPASAPMPCLTSNSAPAPTHGRRNTSERQPVCGVEVWNMWMWNIKSTLTRGSLRQSGRAAGPLPPACESVGANVALKRAPVPHSSDASRAPEFMMDTTPHGIHDKMHLARGSES